MPDKTTREVAAGSSFFLYNDGLDNISVRVYLKNNTIWLPQRTMAELFDTSPDNISLHLKNIYLEEELLEKATTEESSVVQKEGSREVQRRLKLYNLDAIIAVGYRVNSKKATRFRIWATQILKELIINGFVLDDRRLKQGEQVFAQDYFNELLERVRSIRASERRIYQKITDLFAEISVDYDRTSELTKNFYATIQNKFHYAIAGRTAAEIIYEQADKSAPHMGLTSWKNSPKGRVLSSDVTIAKNYLKEKEIKRLERTISGFFDYIETVIESRTTMTMQDIVDRVDKFLNFNEFEVLKGKGKISKKQADQKALREYQDFNKHQQINSDFDRLITHTLKNKEK
jgi:hypothetical protein